MNEIRNVLSKVTDLLEPRFGEIMWHLDTEWQEGNTAFFLGYNEGNDFVELSVYAYTTYTIRYLTADDGWVEDVDLSTSE